MVKIQGVKADLLSNMLLVSQVVSLTCCMLGWGEEERAKCVSFMFINMGLFQWLRFILEFGYCSLFFICLS